MKPLFFLFIFFGLTIFSCTDNNNLPSVEKTDVVENRNTACTPPITAGCWPTETVTTTTNYQGCDVKVTYKRRFCFGGFEINADIWDIQVDYTHCPGFNAYMLQLYFSGQHTALVNTQNDLYAQIVKESEVAAVVFLNNIIDVDCDDTNKYYQVSTFLVHCRNWVRDGNVIREHYCGDSCCKSKTRYCVNEEGQVVAGPTEVNLVTDCIINPNPFGTPLTPCISPCELLDFSR